MSINTTTNLSWGDLAAKQRVASRPEGNFAVKSILFRGIPVRLNHEQLGETKIALTITNPDEVISVLTEDDLLQEAVITEGVELGYWNSPFWGKSRPQLWTGMFRLTPEKEGEKSLWLGEGWLNFGTCWKFRVYADSLGMVFQSEKDSMQYAIPRISEWNHTNDGLAWLASTFEVDVSHLSTRKQEVAQ